MSALETAQRYLDGWNARDASAVLATMAENGTYSDPTTNGPIGGQAFAEYVNVLITGFPDVRFEVQSLGLVAPDLVAVQWIMRGTQTGPMLGAPPTGRKVEVPGADFLRIVDGRIVSAQGYFDTGGLAKQMGLG